MPVRDRASRALLCPSRRFDVVLTAMRRPSPGTPSWSAYSVFLPLASQLGSPQSAGRLFVLSVTCRTSPHCTSISMFRAPNFPLSLSPVIELRSEIEWGAVGAAWNVRAPPSARPHTRAVASWGRKYLRRKCRPRRPSVRGVAAACPSATCCAGEQIPKSRSEPRERENSSIRERVVAGGLRVNPHSACTTRTLHAKRRGEPIISGVLSGWEKWRPFSVPRDLT